MCLSYVSILPKKLPKLLWKSMRARDGQLLSVVKNVSYPVGEWIDCEEGPFIGDTGRVPKYPMGFHAFATRESADILTAMYNMIDQQFGVGTHFVTKQVKLDKFHTYGMQGTLHRVFVAKRMYIMK